MELLLAILIGLGIGQGTVNQQYNKFDARLKKLEKEQVVLVDQTVQNTISISQIKLKTFNDGLLRGDN